MLSGVYGFDYDVSLQIGSLSCYDIIVGNGLMMDVSMVGGIEEDVHWLMKFCIKLQVANRVESFLVCG